MIEEQAVAAAAVMIGAVMIDLPWEDTKTDGLEWAVVLAAICIVAGTEVERQNKGKFLKDHILMHY